MHYGSAEQARKDVASAAKKIEKEMMSKDMAAASEAAHKRKAAKAVDGQKKVKAPKKVAAKKKPGKVDKKKDDMESEALGASTKKDGETKRKGKPVARAQKAVAAKEAQKASKAQDKQQTTKPIVQSKEPEGQKIEQMDTEESREQEGMVRAPMRRDLDMGSDKKYPHGSVTVAEAVVKGAIVDAVQERGQKVEHVTVDKEHHASSKQPPTSDNVLRQVSKKAMQDNETKKKSKKKYKR